MSSLSQHIFGGLFLGSIYALLAIGYSLMWSTTRAVNFSNGDSLMLTAVLTALLLPVGVPLGVAALIALAAVAIYGVLVQRLLVRPFLSAGTNGWVLATIAAGIMVEAAVNVLFGSVPRALPSPGVSEPVRWLGAALYLQEWVTPLVAFLAVSGLVVFLRRTSFGRAARASAENPAAAELMGIDTQRISAIAFAVAAIFGGLAGLLVAPINQVQAQMGLLIGLKGFAVAIVAGSGALWGALALGWLLGIGEQFVSAYAGSGFRDVAVFSAIIILLLLRPQGLFAKTELKKV